MKMYMQNYQYNHGIKSTSNGLNLSKIKYMSYFDLFQAILGEYQDLEEYKKLKFYSALESRIGTTNYNKRFDKMKSFEKILEAIPVEIFNIYREILIPRCVNHYLSDEKLFNNICEKFCITQEEINIAKIKIQKSHEENQANKERLEIKQHESKVKKQVTKITQDKSTYELIQQNSSGIGKSGWIMQSQIRGNISGLNSQEYINRSIELIFTYDSEYVYKNTQAGINGSYLISPEFIDLIILLYKSLTNKLLFLNQDEIDEYLQEKNITIKEYLLKNYIANKAIIDKTEVNVFGRINLSYTLKLI